MASIYKGGQNPENSLVSDLINVPTGMVRLIVDQENGHPRKIFISSNTLLLALDAYFLVKIPITDEMEG